MGTTEPITSTPDTPIVTDGMIIPTFSNIGRRGLPIDNNAARYIDIVCMNTNYSKIVQLLNKGYADEAWYGFTNAYNSLNLIHVGLAIIKLYYYLRSIDNTVLDFDTFVEQYEYKESLSYLLCNNIDVKDCINKLNI